jgi:hypothetical protein
MLDNSRPNEKKFNLRTRTLYLVGKSIYIESNSGAEPARCQKLDLHKTHAAKLAHPSFFFFREPKRGGARAVSDENDAPKMDANAEFNFFYPPTAGRGLS